MEDKRMTKEEFEIWLELVGGKMISYPDFRRASCKAEFTLSNGVEVHVNMTALEEVAGTLYYSHNQDYTHLRVKTYWGSACNLYGKGARSSETWAELKSLWQALIPEAE